MTTPRFVLPGSWARIPIEPESASLAAIRKLTEQATRRKDELATTRAELRARFRRAVEVAREGGASEMYIGLQLTPDIPLPAWAAIFPMSVESADLNALGFGDAAKALDFAVGDAPEEGTKAADTDADTGVHAVRHAWRRKTEVAEGDVAESFDVLEVDYWLLASNPNRLALATFSTALTEYEDEMIGLFDAVVGTLRWPAPQEDATD